MEAVIAVEADRGAFLRRAFNLCPVSHPFTAPCDCCHSIGIALRAAYDEGLERAARLAEPVIECCECLDGNHGRAAKAIREAGGFG